jgi:cytochrome P450
MAARPTINSTPPGPHNAFLLGNVKAINDDPLRFTMNWSRKFGDIVYFHLLNIPVYLLSNPAEIERVLVTEARNFVKSRDYRGLRVIFGNGLLTSEGDFWMRQRRLAQPAFSHDRIQTYGEIMVRFAQRTLDHWRDGEARDIHQDMMTLTLEIVAKALFDADVSDDALLVRSSLNELLQNVEVGKLFFPFLMKLPTLKNLRFRRAISRLDKVIYSVIAQRRGNGAGPDDLLSRMLHAQDLDGSRMTDQQLRDELITLFLAGHETTALALSWTWLLLSQHPETEQKLHRELDDVLNGRAPNIGDVPRLRYTQHVITESMRLYPPAWGVGREAVRACEIGGYSVPAGAQIWISEWITHRSPKFFAEPDQFRPERWENDFAKRLPKFAYFPFGGGPRLCIGQSFAMLEAVLLLATIAQRYRLFLIPGQDIMPWASLTLRPKNGIKVRLERRSLN